MVVLMLSEEMEKDDVVTMMSGGALPLSSSFRLRYNTLLRLYSMESLQPERLVSQSFYAFQRAADVPRLHERRDAHLARALALRQPNESALATLLAARAEHSALLDDAHALALTPQRCLRFLQPGRVCHVADGKTCVFGWGVVVGFRHTANRFLTDAVVNACTRDDIVVDVLLPLAPGAAALVAETYGATPLPTALSDAAAEGHVLSVQLRMLTRLSAARLWLPADLRDDRARHRCLESLRSLMTSPERLGTPIRAEHACLHPVAHLGAGDQAVDLDVAMAQRTAMAKVDAAKAREVELVDELSATIATDDKPLVETADADGSAVADGGEAADTAHAAVEGSIARLVKRHAAEAEADAVSREAVALTVNDFGAETDRMRAVMRQLGHVDAENVVLIKGRAAAEVEACDELLAAEILLGGTLHPLTPAVAISLCACLVAEQSEKVKKAPPMHADLVAPFQELQQTARTLAGVLSGAGIETDEAEFVARFDGGLMSVVYAWANGATFEALTQMCDLFEGSLIRVIRRLSELLDELQSAAKAIGNDELYKKFDDGAKMIRRDIVFAASLYIEG